MKTLFGEKGVQGLDGEAHRRRNAMFMDLMTKQSLDELVQISHRYWLAAINDWQQRDSPVVLKEAAAEVLTQSICQWVGVPLEPDEIKHRTHQFIRMIESAGKVLTMEVDYVVPGQNLFLPHNKMPTLPESGFIICKVKLFSAAVTAET